MPRAISMCQAQPSLAKFHIILSSIAQAQTRLRGIEQNQALQPMKYCARLAWEALYEARQILKRSPTQSPSQAYSKYQHKHGLQTNVLAQIELTVEQVMSTLQIIETDNDKSAMQTSAQNCLQQLSEITKILNRLK